MTMLFRIILIIVCVLMSAGVLWKIRKAQMRIEDSVFWFGISLALVILSAFPSLATKFSEVLGIGTTVNFCFLAMIFILLLKVFLMSIKMSKVENKLNMLIQALAIKEYEGNQKNENDNLDEVRGKE